MIARPAVPVQGSVRKSQRKPVSTRKHLISSHFLVTISVFLAQFAGLQVPPGLSRARSVHTRRDPRPSDAIRARTPSEPTRCDPRLRVAIETQRDASRAYVAVQARTMLSVPARHPNQHDAIRGYGSPSGLMNHRRHHLRTCASSSPAPAGSRAHGSSPDCWPTGTRCAGWPETRHGLIWTGSRTLRRLALWTHHTHHTLRRPMLWTLHRLECARVSRALTPHPRLPQPRNP
jgi:hypothetical protein